MSESTNKMRYLLTGPRLIEMALVALVSSAISGVLVSWASVQVLQSEVAHLRQVQDEMRAELRQLRNDLYRPRGWESHMLELQPDDLIVELRESLHSAADHFHGRPESEPEAGDADPDSDFKRHLRVAANEFGRWRGRTLVGEIDLQANVGIYTGLPADLVDIKAPLWGSEKRIEVWADNHPGPMPRQRLVTNSQGEHTLVLVPAPTQAQISTLGSTYRFYYTASAWDGADNSAILVDRPDDRDLILLRAQAEAARELAIQNITKPIQTRTSLSMPSNSSPRALYEALLAEFHRRVGAVAA